MHKISGIYYGFPQLNGMYVVFRRTQKTATIAQVNEGKFRFLRANGSWIRQGKWHSPLLWEDDWKWFATNNVDLRNEMSDVRTASN